MSKAGGRDFQPCSVSTIPAQVVSSTRASANAVGRVRASASSVCLPDADVAPEPERLTDRIATSLSHSPRSDPKLWLAKRNHVLAPIEPVWEIVDHVEVPRVHPLDILSCVGCRLIPVGKHASHGVVRHVFEGEAELAQVRQLLWRHSCVLVSPAKCHQHIASLPRHPLELAEPA